MSYDHAYSFEALGWPIQIKNFYDTSHTVFPWNVSLDRDTPDM